MLSSRVGLMLLLPQAVACVPSAPRFITDAEARAGHPAEDAEYGAVDAWVKENDLPERPSEAPPNRRAVPRASYWHWNGLAYERVDAAWDDPSPAYLWQWDKDSVSPR